MVKLENWLGDSTLQVMYPSLFLLATNPNSMVEQNRSGNTWDVQFRRNMQDWELNDVCDLLGRLNSCTVDSQSSDRRRWGSSKEGNIQCKGRLSPDVLTEWSYWCMAWKLIWRTKLPPKESCSIWTALEGAILTQDNLCRRKFQLE